MLDDEKPPQTSAAEEKIFVACDVLAARGKKPTTSNIFEHLGRAGSKSTISKYLTKWRAERGQDDYRSPPAMTHSIRNYLDDFAENIWSLCYRDISAQLFVEMEKLREEIESLQDENQKMHKMCEDRDQLLITIGRLEAQSEEPKLSASKTGKRTSGAGSPLNDPAGERDQLSFLPDDAAPASAGS